MKAKPFWHNVSSPGRDRKYVNREDQSVEIFGKECFSKKTVRWWVSCGDEHVEVKTLASAKKIGYDMVQKRKLSCDTSTG
jgi:hypothetical protein